MNAVLKLQRGDLITFAAGERVLVGKVLYPLEYGEWKVMYVNDYGRAVMFNVWECDAALHNRCDFDIRREIEFVVWDALESGTNWGEKRCENRSSL